MIAGVVNAEIEATVRLVVVGPAGRQQEIEALIDTGFSGHLTLPPALIASLGLTWLGRDEGILADGSVDLFDVYATTVIWDGQARTIEAEAVDAQSLLGMSLLAEHSMRIDAVPGGVVTITRLT